MCLVAGKSLTMYLWLFAFLGLGWAEDFPKNSEMTGIIRVRRMSPSTASSCVVPPQPTNGRWKLHRLYCDYDVDCDIPQGIGLQSGSQLVYSCNPGYSIETNSDVHCTAKGTWSATPNCVKMKCSSLNSVSRITTCYHSNEAVDCDSPVFPETRAQVSCRPGYRKDIESLLEQGDSVVCNQHGKWEPDPIRCLEECGKIRPSASATRSRSPWHASVYLLKNTKDVIEKEYVCSGTLIRANLVLTAAYCVYNEKLGAAEDPAKLFVMILNIFRGYDHDANQDPTVTRGSVKNVHLHCNYVGSVGNYIANIALIELQKPFVLSSIILPACLEIPGYNEQVLEPGADGAIVGFGDDTVDVHRGAPDIVNSRILPYISYSQCNSSLSVSKFSNIIQKDKFCAGLLNKNLFLGNKGGGLTFTQCDRSYVVGTLHMVFKPQGRVGPGDRRGDIISVFTKVSHYTRWILDVIFNIEHHGSHPPCGHEMSDVQTTTAVPTSTEIPMEISISNSSIAEFSCTVPPQPDNGEWSFHGDICGSNKNCRIPQYTTVKPGSKLIYSCAPGYKVSGNTEVHCEVRGDWSAIPVCIEVKCDPLNSLSTIASCSRFGEFVSCDSPVSPQTEAKISCRPGYKKDSVFTVTRKEIVNCTEYGKWEPNPVRCVPVCGTAITHQTPNAIGGTTARIGDFPWHASLYVERNTRNQTRKGFICGATIIHSNFLLTAAHCVYDEGTKTNMNPKKLFVMTGNIFRDYDYRGHNLEIVRQASVKNIFKHSSYYGLLGNYMSDIALLELHHPFEFSGILVPACLDVDGYSDQILEPGALGKVAGFGRTATSPTSAILQTLTVPFVAYSQCKSSKSTNSNEYFISNDKFCAGYNNGTSVCDGDSGGGLVFQRNDLWYVLGIVSVSLGVDLDSGEKTCDKYSYTLYSKVSMYMQWIHDVISYPERYKF